jgi:hypothetical protein
LILFATDAAHVADLFDCSGIFMQNWMTVPGVADIWTKEPTCAPFT